MTHIQSTSVDPFRGQRELVSVVKRVINSGCGKKFLCKTLAFTDNMSLHLDSL